MTLGKQQTRQQNSDEHTAYTGSVIGTTGGNIRLEAGDDTDVINSDIIAQKDETDANTGNILFKSQAVNITSQNATAANTHSFSQKTSGLTAGVSSSLVSDVQSLDKLTDAAKDTNSRRMTIMAAAAGTSKAYTLTNNLHNKNFGSMRAQATIGSQTTKSDSHSHQEVNDAANVYAEGNLIFDVSGKGADSTVTITGSNITAKQNLYNQVEGSVIYQASTQTSTQDSQNSSKGAGFGVYASANLSTDGLSSNSAGFTINANKAKGSSQEIATTHTNTQITVGGTTINDIGGSLILDGANLDTTYLTGTVGKDLIVKSRQDTYQYNSNQTQVGGNLDVSFQGTPQSASITGGNTNANASYAQVTDQTGIKTKESTLQVQGKSKLTGGYLITDQGKNHTQFAQGIQTQDIENHLNYEGNAISLGIGIGADTSNPDNKAKPTLQGLGYGTITPAHKTSTTHSAITDQAGLSHINTGNFKQEEIQNQLNEIIANDFNQAQAHKELNAQVTITTEFGREAPKAVAEFSGYQEAVILSKLDDAENLSDEQINQILDEAAKWSEGGIYRVALHTAAAALATGTVEGAASAGGTAYAIPKIDEYLKEQDFDKQTRDITLLALSAGLGASIGGDTASTVNNVGQTEWNYLYHESALKSSKLNARQRRHIQALKDAGAVSYEEIEKKYDNCKGNKECEVAVKKEWQRESDRTRQIELDLVKQGVLTWEDFDQFTGGFIGVDTPHLAAIQNKRHTLAAMEISSWTQPDATARNEALRRDGGVTPGSTEDLLMQAGAGTVGAAVAGRGSRTPTKANNQTLSPVTPIANSGAAYRQNIITVANNRQLTQMPITINNKTYQPIAQPTTAGAPIYRGVSTQDIYQAFKDIAGIKTLPQTGSPMYQAIPGKTSPSGKPGYIIKVPQSDGSTVLLRNFATSNREHPVRFTIEIQRSSTSLGPKKLELKFE